MALQGRSSIITHYLYSLYKRKTACFAVVWKKNSNFAALKQYLSITPKNYERHSEPSARMHLAQFLQSDTGATPRSVGFATPFGPRSVGFATRSARSVGFVIRPLRI